MAKQNEFLHCSEMVHVCFIIMVRPEEDDGLLVFFL